MLARMARVGSGCQASRLIGWRAFATPASTPLSRGLPSAQAVETAVRGVDDLDRSELVNDASHSIDRALIERMLQSDDQEAAAREWLNEMATGQLHQDFEQYLDWEDAQLAKVRALRAGGVVEPAAAGSAVAASEPAEGEGGETAESALESTDDVDTADAADADDGRLLPRIPVEHVADFPGELLRAELLSPAERLQLETTAAVHAAEGMPFELSEISHR
jgi:predicted transcriptional regulator